MSSFDLYEATIPTWTKALKVADHILDKAEEHAKEKGVDADATFLNAGLIEDQWPFKRQIQDVGRRIQFNVARLYGKDAPSFADRTQSFAELRKWLNETRDLLKTVDKAQVNAGQDKIIPVLFGGRTVPVHIPIREAVLYHGQTNVFFHLVTAYSILRAKGVSIGKVDYLSGFLL